MSDQFDVVEVGERGRRRWIGLLVLAALVVTPIVGLLASRDPGRPPSPTGPPTADAVPSMMVTISGDGNLLHAKPVVQGSQAKLQVVFPDGRKGELTYPADMRLDELGSRPFRGVWVDGAYLQLFAPYEGEVEISKGGQPIRSLTSTVTLWPHQPGFPSDGQVLVFRFGPWRLAMYDRQDGLTFEQRLAAAADLKGKVVGRGYLVLNDGGIVRLAVPGETARGDPVGPQLWFGGDGGDMLAVIPTPHCDKTAKLPSVVDGRGRPGKFICRGEVEIAASGDETFVRQAMEGVRITLK